ncbi:MAG: aminoglycoside phosphotransferase family protein [Cyclobacteriaceae bacterium]
MNEQELVLQFDIEGAISSIEPFGSGHINNSFKVATESANSPDYFLQQVNHQVFHDIPGMMKNIWFISEHIRKKDLQNTDQNVEQEHMEVIKTKKGELFFIDSNGAYWRMFVFKTGLHSYDLVESPEQAYEGGKAFGTFLSLLSDFPHENLSITIPDFNNLYFRLGQLEDAVKNDSLGRVIEVKNELDFVQTHAKQMCQIEDLKNSRAIPIRTTHNDTKFNNVLLDGQGIGRCVIDLDTVMPGVVHYDFGDGIRSSTACTVEDEPDLSQVDFDIDKFEGFTAGYLAATKHILTKTEKEYLALSGALFPFMIGLRFLTDYISGDKYFKIGREKHNLDRARCQLKMSEKILNRLDELNKIVSKNY